MRGTAQLDTFTANPIGRYLVGRSWLYWCARPDLYGIVLWGRPTEDDVVVLARALTVELAPGVVPHRSLIDARRLEGVDAGAFAVLSRYVQAHHDLLSQRVTQLALVKPGGFAGAITAGFYEVLDAPYPVKLFDTASAAFIWLTGTPETSVAATLDEAYLNIAGVPALVAQLRTLLTDHLLDADIRRTARLMGLSERTLQRRLKAVETTFQHELTQVRIAEARRRMLDSDASLTQIAMDIGFGSLQHFSGHFSKCVGESPSAWRAQRIDR